MQTSYPAEALRILPDSVSFVAALLVEFPEFASAAFDPRQGTLRLTLLVGRRLPAPARAAFARRLEESVAVLRELQGGPVSRVEVRWQVGPNFTRFDLVRSVDDLTFEELRVVAHVARDRFGSDLLAGEEGGEEDREDELRYALERARRLRPSRPVVGVREGGRVLVYYAPRSPRRVREQAP
jgi:hypothetical protein